MKLRHVDDSELERFTDDGVVFLPQLVNAETVELLTRRVTDLRSSTGPYSSNMSKDGDFYEERNGYQRDKVLKDFTFESGLAGLAGRAMDASFTRLLVDHIFVCGPNTPTDYYWHQDTPYWPVSGRQLVSVWLALTDCDKNSAALNFVPGTHKGTLFGVRKFGDGEDWSEINAEPDKEIPKYEQDPETYNLIERDIRAGDAYLFNAHVMHGSGGNRSEDRTRIAYSTRWIGDDVRWQPKDFEDPAIVDAGKNLQPGDALDCDGFPLLWSRATR